MFIIILTLSLSEHRAASPADPKSNRQERTGVSQKVLVPKTYLVYYKKNIKDDLWVKTHL